MNNRRRNFRSRPQKNNFRRRNGALNSTNSSTYNNGNINFSRNGSMNNPHSVEKTMLKFQQLAKDAQTNRVKSRKIELINYLYGTKFK